MDDVRIIARNIGTMRYVGRGLIALDVGMQKKPNIQTL